MEASIHIAYGSEYTSNIKYCILYDLKHKKAILPDLKSESSVTVLHDHFVT